MEPVKITALAKLLMKGDDEAEQRQMATVIRNLPSQPKKTKEPEKTRISWRDMVKAKVVHKATGEKLFGLALLEEDKGTISADVFIAAMKSAGRRPFPTEKKGLDGSPIMVWKTEEKHVRPDCIIAIHQFMKEGYNRNGNFGAQELAARAEAGRQLGYNKTHGQTRGEIRTSWRKALVQGAQKVSYDRGLCDQHKKRIAHLRGAEGMYASEVIDLQKILDNVELPLEIRQLALEKQVVAEEKLAHVKRDLINAAQDPNGAKWIHWDLEK